MDYMDSTVKTLDICIYLVTCHGLAIYFLKSHACGVQVRIIADVDRADGYRPQMKTFLEKGIPVCMKESPYLMHHKFFIVDRRVLVTGSLHWTVQAITGNWDNVIVTYDTGIVKPFNEHFKYQWEDFVELKQLQR